MELGIMTEPQTGGTYDELLAVAQWAEAAGLVAFARSDHYYGWSRDPKPDTTDAFATLAGLARDTKRIQLVVLVAPFTFRHPAVVAKNAVTIDQMSGGRFGLGVGTGWNEAEHTAFGMAFPQSSERFERLEEGLQYLRACFTDGQFAGRHYQLDADVNPKPTGPLPLIVGGSGPKRTPGLAGRYADEYNVFPSDPDSIAARVKILRRSAEQAGRDPDAIRVSVMSPIYAEETRHAYESMVARLAEQRSMDPDQLQQRWAAAFVPAGSTADVVEMLDRYKVAGVSRFYVQFVDLPSPDSLDRAFSAIPR